MCSVIEVFCSVIEVFCSVVEVFCSVIEVYCTVIKVFCSVIEVPNYNYLNNRTNEIFGYCCCSTTLRELLEPMETNLNKESWQQWEVSDGVGSGGSGGILSHGDRSPRQALSFGGGTRQ